MSTLPASFRQTKRDSGNKRGTFQSCPKLDKVKPRRLDNPIQNHAYFIQDVLDSQWTKELLDLLENTYGYTCAEYSRDFVLGEKVLDLMSSFIFTSDKIVMVLSENFLNSRLAMHQLQLAMHYDIDHGKNNIVALHIDTCEVPKQLLPFEYIDTKTDNSFWIEKFLTYLSKPAPTMQKEICTFEGTHVSVDEICKTQRSVMSDPPTLNPARNGLCIPDHIRQQIKIWHRSKSIDENQQCKKSTVNCDTDAISTKTEDEIQGPPEDVRTVEYSIDQINNHQAALMHSLKMRIHGKQLFEVTKPKIAKNEEELSVHPGDVLEVLRDAPLRGSMLKCENAQGKVGLVPRGLLAPSVHLLPSSIVKLCQQPVSASENNNFKGELVRFGLSYYTANENLERGRHNAMCMSVKKGDVLCRLSDVAGGRAMFRNCRNESGYLGMSYVTQVPVDALSTPDRLSNTSIGSEGYGSETGEHACSNV